MSLGSSLGLPSELLGSLSGSSYLGSDSEGDTVQSALASALGMLGASGEGLSADGSTEGIPSLSQSGNSLPYDQKLPEATPSPGHLEPVQMPPALMESLSASMEVRNELP